MSNTNANQDQATYEYGGYAAQQPAYADNSPDEVPQSSYPHTAYAPADLPSYSQEQPYGYQQPTQGGGQQQQYEYQQPPLGAQQQYYQPPFTTPGDVSPFESTSMGMKARTAAMLGYLFGWATGLAVLLLERDNRFVRFHAMQSLLFFGSLSILDRVLSWMPFGLDHGIDTVVGIVMVVGWFVLLNAARKGKYYKLPLFGDYAERFIDKIKIK
ncbi:MAG TPA: hypothetical protein VKR06_29055 [Ktedonosporobacter sp.]|nr:hypothetical protein [Ktedonosporobacter sp.]